MLPTEFVWKPNQNGGSYVPNSPQRNGRRKKYADRKKKELEQRVKNQKKHSVRKQQTIVFLVFAI